MSSDLDMTQYLDLFLQEAEEQLEILEQETIRLEEDPSTDRMSAIFRAAHTLKGSSRAMGFSNLAGVTHEMENMLDALRGGHLALNTEIANALLKCQDTLRDMKDAITNGQGDAIDATLLVQHLQALQNGASAPKVVDGQTVEVTEESSPLLPANVLDALDIASGQKPVYHANFNLRPDCVMKFVRAFMAINLIQDGGELLACVPDTETLEEEKFDLQFDLWFHHTDGPAVMKTKFAGIAEIDSYDIFTYKPQDHAQATKAPVTETATSPQAAEEDDGDKEVTAEVTPTKAPVAPAPAAPQTPTPTAAPTGKKIESNQTVRVDVARLDELMNLVGELVIDRTRIAQIGAVLASRYEMDSNIEALAETVGHITRITSDLQDQLMKARMLPIETVFNRFPRMIRDLAQKLNKEVKLELVGGETELDRSVIEVIGDPLLHILRNSIDHGIEMPDAREKLGKPRVGKVVVSARHQENHIVIEIIDDGAGIDAARVKKKALESGVITQDQADRMSEKDALQLIFASGLSTAAEVTEVSGRGVGMDIVRSNIHKLGGLIDLETTLGEGSRFQLRLPLTLAIIRGLLVRVSGVAYVLPLGSVVETLLVEEDQIQTINQNEVIVIRGMTTPLVRLRKIFTTRNFVEEEQSSGFYVVIVGLADQRVGLVVDSLIGEQEVVIKSLNRFCGDVRGISGATILGNGNVALIVDVNGVLALERR